MANIHLKSLRWWNHLVALQLLNEWKNFDKYLNVTQRLKIPDCL